MVQFIKEPNNLCNVNTFKHLGLATKKTISVQAGKDSGVVLATIKTNKKKYPSALVHKTVMKREKYLVAQGYRLDIGAETSVQPASRFLKVHKYYSEKLFVHCSSGTNEF
ncbi:hypothetical protein MKW98_012719 [Papaver atlanticum]|uniref:Ribosomal eL28/Mak16 domain-containing protein n=1 Tax=Papaver atlanticum TaxID=357466 RepID=A0AAD4XLE0_9MAGN|nr:hypothetical protein MKW98_012719 [Papaver atlanticum]